MKTKDQLRIHLKELRRNISKERKEEAKQKAYQELLFFSSSYERVLSFMSLEDEIDLSEVNKILAQKKTLLLPKIEKSSLTIYEVLDLKTLVKSSWGVFEPDPSQSNKTALSKKDLILVPGLGFDLKCHRIGYGQGHFDRFLEANVLVKTVGVGFEEQLIFEDITIEKHDQQLSAVILF